MAECQDKLCIKCWIWRMEWSVVRRQSQGSIVLVFVSLFSSKQPRSRKVLSASSLLLYTTITKRHMLLGRKMNFWSEQLGFASWPCHLVWISGKCFNLSDPPCLYFLNKRWCWWCQGWNREMSIQCLFGPILSWLSYLHSKYLVLFP